MYLASKLNSEIRVILLIKLGIKMAILSCEATFKGIVPLLQKNPQTVDRFNQFAKKMAIINAKKTRRTDEDYLKLADLEIEASIYWDDSLGIYVPARWVMAAMCKISNKVAKIPKADIRASIIPVTDKSKLIYKSMNLVKSPVDVIKNDFFRHRMLLPQGQVRIAKSTPIFHEWSFSQTLEYDNTVLDKDDLVRILTHAATRGGFGDFRPTFGRATVEISHG